MFVLTTDGQSDPSSRGMSDDKALIVVQNVPRHVKQVTVSSILRNTYPRVLRVNSNFRALTVHHSSMLIGGLMKTGIGIDDGTW